MEGGTKNGNSRSFTTIDYSAPSVIPGVVANAVNPGHTRVVK
jgi:hypothetical protein